MFPPYAETVNPRSQGLPFIVSSPRKPASNRQVSRPQACSDRTTDKLLDSSKPEIELELQSPWRLPKKVRELQEWLDTQLVACADRNDEASIQRFATHVKVLAQLSELLPSYRPLLQRLHDEFRQFEPRLAGEASRREFEDTNRKRVAFLSGLQQTTEARAGQALKQLEELRADLAVAMQEVEASRSEKAAQEYRVSKRQHDYERVKIQLQDVQIQLKEERNRMHEQVAALQLHIRSQEQESQRALHALEHKLWQQHRQEVTALQRQIIQRDHQVNELQGECAELRETVNSFRVQEEELRKQLAMTLKPDCPETGRLAHSRSASFSNGRFAELTIVEAPAETTVTREQPKASNDNEYLEYQHKADQDIIQRLRHRCQSLEVQLDALVKGAAGLADVPERPEGLATEADESMKSRQRRDPSHWTTTIQQWSDLLSCCTADRLPPDRIVSSTQMSMNDVNQEFVKPWSKGTGCGVALLMSQAAAQEAKMMLSHSWTEYVCECHEAVITYVQRKDIPKTTPLWFCVFAIYQAEDDFGPSIPEQLQINPFESVVLALSGNGVGTGSDAGYGVCAVHTPNGDLYARLWCVYEIESSLGAGVEVHAAMSKEYIDRTISRLQKFLDAEATWEESLVACGIRIRTACAQCSRVEDEDKIHANIFKRRRTFKAVDDAIEEFRRETFGEHREFWLAAVSRGATLQHAGTSIRKDEEIVLSSVRQDAEELQYADDKLKGDRAIVLEAVTRFGQALRFAAAELQRDTDVVMKAVMQDGLSLQYAATALLANKDLVLAAVRNNGMALQYVSEDLRKDPEVAFAAVDSDVHALRHVSSMRIKSDTLAALSSTGRAPVLQRTGSMKSELDNIDQYNEMSDSTKKLTSRLSIAEEATQRLTHRLSFQETLLKLRPLVKEVKPRRAIALLFNAIQMAYKKTPQDDAWFEVLKAHVKQRFDESAKQEQDDYIDMFAAVANLPIDHKFKDDHFPVLCSTKLGPSIDDQRRCEYPRPRSASLSTDAHQEHKPVSKDI